jgi:hypothetical protein
MFENSLRSFSKFFTNQRIIFLLVFIILVWGLVMYSGVKSLKVDTMTNVDSYYNGPSSTNYGNTAPYHENTAPYYENSDPNYENNYSQPPSMMVNTSMDSNNDSQYTVQPVANPTDLLPNDQNSQWAALNPNSLSQGNVLVPDLLQAGYHIGLDTIGQTLRNANLQLRSDPIIPKVSIGPWSQSTIEPDLGRVPLELGQGLQ